MNDSENTLIPLGSQLPVVQSVPDPAASPFKIVVDPVMRSRLREGIIELIDNHDRELARHFSEGRLALDSYKEYIEFLPKASSRPWKAARALITSCAPAALK